MHQRCRFYLSGILPYDFGLFVNVAISRLETEAMGDSLNQISRTTCAG